MFLRKIHHLCQTINIIVPSTFGFFNIPKRQLKTNQEIPENNSIPVYSGVHFYSLLNYLMDAYGFVEIISFMRKETNLLNCCNYLI